MNVYPLRPCTLLAGFLFALLAQGLAAMPLGAEPSATARPAVPAGFGSAAMAAAGSQLYGAKNCTQCHGIGGTGGVRLVGNQLEPEEIFETISQGRIRGAMRMPMWQGILTDEEIWQLAAYVHSLK